MLKLTLILACNNLAIGKTNKLSAIMSLSVEKIKKLFSYLEDGNSMEFFNHVADNVTWTVMGTHPLAGFYNSKQSFLEHTFHRLNKILKEGVILKVRNIFIDNNIAIVEMDSISTAINGKPFNNTYCWITYFTGDTITKVTAYVDSALVQQVIDENE